MKPFLKWTGGKTRIIDDITSNFPAYDLYVEPFIGGGSVFFNQQPKNAIIADVNKNLINTYISIRDDIENLLVSLKRLKQDYNDTKDKETFYYRIRDEYNRLKNTDNCSAYFIFLNKTCFNGMYRENKNGSYNVPFGKYKNPEIYNPELLRLVSKYLNDNNIAIKCCSYQETLTMLNNASGKILVYLDPPYYPSETSKFTSYTKEPFGIKEQKELKKELDKVVASSEVYIAMSNSKCDGIYQLYDAYVIKEISVHRSISSKKETRGMTVEVLILNYLF